MFAHQGSRLEFVTRCIHISVAALRTRKRILKAKMMSRIDTSRPAQARVQPRKAPVSNFTFAALFTAIGAIVLIASEIWLTALAAIWAADGFLGLSTTGDI
jgi:hypothetical protein